MKFALITFGNEESYGLLFVGGELLEHEQQIKFFDGEESNVVTSVAAWMPDFIMFSPMTTFYNKALSISRSIKELNSNIVSVFGGHHAMFVPDIVESDGVDVVVVGPVRGSIEQILDGSVDVIKTEPTEPSDLPRPARLQYYNDIPRMGRRYRKFILSMLGCPWNCSYCSSASSHMRMLFGNDAHSRYYLHRRPVDVVIEEAMEITGFNTKEIEWVDDDVFTGVDVEEWMPEFACEWKAKINLPMYVSATSVSVLRASDSLLRCLQGIVRVVGMGVQACRPESLKLFNRQWDNEQKMKSAYDRLSSFGYKVNLQCIVGLPVSDPVEDAMDTIKCMQRIGAGSVCSCYPLQIYPATKIEKHCIDNKLSMNSECSGDTNSADAGILFPHKIARRLKNICKLATMFVKYNVDEHWMRALIDVDLDDDASRNLSVARYRDCVVDRGNDGGEHIFESLMTDTKLRY